MGLALFGSRFIYSSTLPNTSRGESINEIPQLLSFAAFFGSNSRSRPSSLAVRLARELRLTLVGFLRQKRFVVYAGEERISE